MFKLAYEIKVCNLPAGLSAWAFTRQQLDRLGIGQDLDILPSGGTKVKLPPSTLPSEKK
jgi:hypothetical protein